jgi:hypothetical protein
MKVLRSGKFAMTTIAAILLAWTFASNHCAWESLRSHSPANSAGHECCDKKSPQPTSPKTLVTCCDSMKVPLPAVAMAPATNWLALEPAWPETAATLSLPEPVAPSSRANESPPQAESFSELVLCRSLLSHAPPFVVA